MYKKNPYLTNTEPKLDERANRIVAKAKKYHISSFENLHFAQNLLSSKSLNKTASKDIINFFAWIVKQEHSLQMSKEKE